MAKNLLKFKPNISIWLNTKPYDIANNYDIFYYKICIEVYEYLLKEHHDFFIEEEKYFDREELFILSCTFVSYFEDFTNKIGLWKAIQLKNKELYGQYLPFYVLNEDYNIDYINRQDIVYLLWFFMSKFNYSANYAPDDAVFLSIADNVFDILETKMNVAPVNDFYEEYLVVNDDQNIFDLIPKLVWFTKKSYLCNLDSSEKYVEVFMEISEPMDSLSRLKPLLYIKELEIILERPTSWATYIPIQWFADVVKCSVSKRLEIQNLTYRHSGKFEIIKKINDNSLILKQLITEKEYIVTLDTFEHERPLLKEGDIVAMSLSYWNNEWIMLGSIQEPFENTPEKIFEYKEERASFWMHSEEKQIKSLPFYSKVSEAFLYYFGTKLAIFPTEETLQAAMFEFIPYFTKSAIELDPSAYSDPTYVKRMQETYAHFDIIKDINRDSDSEFESYATFCDEKIGIMNLINIIKVIEVLETDKPNEEQTSELFYELTRGYHPVIAEYLVNTYSFKNVKYPFKTKVNLNKWFITYLHFYVSEKYTVYNPEIAIIDDFLTQIELSK